MIWYAPTFPTVPYLYKSVSFELFVLSFQGSEMFVSYTSSHLHSQVHLSQVFVELLLHCPHGLVSFIES